MNQKAGVMSFEWHLIIVSSRTPSINGNTFDDSIKTLCLPYVARIRRETQMD
jgi:hypothetical protein